MLEKANLSVSKGDRVCLVGKNGSGKSTLLKVAAGILEPDKGYKYVHPGAKICYLNQEYNYNKQDTVLDFILKEVPFNESREKVNILLNNLSLKENEKLSSLSGGEARRCAIARVLAPNPDILLLDEPTNHLDLLVIEWLEKEILNSNKAIIVISHDRKFLENISNSIIWINENTTFKIKKKFNEFETWKESFLEKEEENKFKLSKKIERETDWLQKGLTARRKRNIGRLKNLNILRAKLKNKRGILSNIDMNLNDSEHSGKRVSYVKNISKFYDDKIIIKNFTTIIQRGERIGIIGPNGVGKTTLLNILIGKIKPDIGEVLLGKNLKIEILDQNRDSLDPDMTVVNYIANGGNHVFINGESKHVMSYMKNFMFPSDKARTPIKVLSGGEKNRIMLAKSLAKPSNVLVLDEPTNDLDMETLDLLQETLSNYKGSIILVSHDRDFVDRIATSIISYEGNGKWSEYPGGYSDMINQRFGKNKNKENFNTNINKIKNLKKKKKVKKILLNKFTFKEEYELKTLPKVIERLELEIKNQQKKLSEPDFFRLDPVLYKFTLDELRKAEKKIKDLENKWLELEIKRESLM